MRLTEEMSKFYPVYPQLLDDPHHYTVEETLLAGSGQWKNGDEGGGESWGAEETDIVG